MKKPIIGVILSLLILSCTPQQLQQTEVVITEGGIAAITAWAPTWVQNAIDKAIDQLLAIAEWSAVQSSIKKVAIPLLQGDSPNIGALTDWMNVILSQCPNISPILSITLKNVVAFLTMNATIPGVDFLKNLPASQPIPKEVIRVFIKGLEAFSGAIGDAIAKDGNPTPINARMMSGKLEWRPR